MPAVASLPYGFPLDGDLSPASTALLMVDMQADFCCAGGFMDRLGFDWRALAAAIPAARALLMAFRVAGFPVIHTRETFASDLGDVQPNRLWRGPAGDRPIVGDAGPRGRHLVRGEPGWRIVPDVAPMPGELTFDKPSYGAFGTTGLDAALRERGLRNLVVCGVTSDCCVRAIVGEALDRGYDCLTVADASAATSPAVHAAAMEQIRRKGGVLGAVAEAGTVLAAIGETVAGEVTA